MSASPGLDKHIFSQRVDFNLKTPAQNRNKIFSILSFSFFLTDPNTLRIFLSSLIALTERKMIWCPASGVKPGLKWMLFFVAIWTHQPHLWPPLTGTLIPTPSRAHALARRRYGAQDLVRTFTNQTICVDRDEVCVAGDLGLRRPWKWLIFL